MSVLQTHVDRSSEQFERNRTAMLERIAELDELLEQVRGGGGERYVQRHRERGKLLVRERIELLVDRDCGVPRAEPVRRPRHRLQGRRRASSPESA